MDISAIDCNKFIGSLALSGHYFEFRQFIGANEYKFNDPGLDSFIYPSAAQIRTYADSVKAVRAILKIQNSMPENLQKLVSSAINESLIRK